VQGGGGGEYGIIGGLEGPLTDKTPVAKSLYRSIFQCCGSEPFFWVQILKFFDADLGSGMEKIRIWDLLFFRKRHFALLYLSTRQTLLSQSYGRLKYLVLKLPRRIYYPPYLMSNYSYFSLKAKIFISAQIFDRTNKQKVQI
jgi:hypothetical protein